MSSCSDSLKICFPQATFDCYWHYLAKNCHSNSTYKADAIEKKVRAIEQKTKQPNSFETKSVHGWTPLHVAAISGNEVGIRFLCSRGVSLDVKDESGLTPIDYCAQLHPDLVEVLRGSSAKSPSANRVDPFQSSLLQEIVCKALEPFRIELCQEPFLYRAHSNDFGVGLKTLLFSKPNDESPEMVAAYKKSGIKIDHFVKNLVQVSQEEGFKLELSEHQHAIRDNCIQLPDGTFVLPSFSKSVMKAIEREGSLALVLKKKPMYCSDHLYFKGTMGASLEQSSKASAEWGRRNGSAACIRFFIEGGNCYRSSNAKGEPKLLIGKGLFFIILNQLRLDKVFDDPLISMGSLAKDFAAALSPEQIRLVVAEMYAQGLLVQGKGCEKGLITRDELLEILQKNLMQSLESSSSSSSDQGSENTYLDLAIALGHYRPLTLTPAQIEACRSIVGKYLAQQEIVMKLIAMTFSIPQEDIHWIPEADYHLDTFMRPGPQGSYFVQDYACCVSLLQHIKDQKQALRLSAQDEVILDRYLRTAIQLDREIGPLLSLAKKELSEAGFQIIPTPAVFYDTSADKLDPRNHEKVKTYNVNFMNAITGWSEKNQRYFYIATGAEAGDHLGSILMQVYTQFLSSYQKGINVHFIGHDPADPSSFTEGMRWWNRHGSQAGPHCFSQELETISHRG